MAGTLGNMILDFKDIPRSCAAVQPDSVTVIIPARNAAPYLTACLASVIAQSGESVQEIVVVDDGSSDGTLAMAEGFFRAQPASSLSLRCLSQPPSGAAAARNLGVLAATGEWLSFLDADDLWLPDKTERQLAALSQDPGHSGAFGSIRQFLSPELPDDVKSRILCPPEPLSGPSIGTLLIRRADFLRVGEFDTTLPVGEFLEWFGRAKDAGLAFLMLPEILMLRRLHRCNQGVLKKDDYAATFRKILRERLRRRAAPQAPVVEAAQTPEPAPPARVP